MKLIRCVYRETSFSYSRKCEKCEEDDPLLELPPDAVFVCVHDMLLDPITKYILHAKITIIVPDEYLEKARELSKQLIQETDTKPYCKFVQDLYLDDYRILLKLRSYLRAIYSDIDLNEISEELQYKKHRNTIEIRYVVRRSF